MTPASGTDVVRVFFVSTGNSPIQSLLYSQRCWSAVPPLFLSRSNIIEFRRAIQADTLACVLEQWSTICTTRVTSTRGLMARRMIRAAANTWFLFLFPGSTIIRRTYDGHKQCGMTYASEYKITHHIFSPTEVWHAIGSLRTLWNSFLELRKTIWYTT